MSSIRFFASPLPALAVLGMAINDHWLKRAYPSWVTGKLSDFLGVFYFPLFLCALFCLAWSLVRRRNVTISRPMMIVAMSITALLMIAVKLSPAISSQIETFFNQHLFKVNMTPDPTDLIALVMLIPSYLYARKYFSVGLDQ